MLDWALTACHQVVSRDEPPLRTPQAAVTRVLAGRLSWTWPGSPGVCGPLGPSGQLFGLPEPALPRRGPAAAPRWCSRRAEDTGEAHVLLGPLASRLLVTSQSGGTCHMLGKGLGCRARPGTDAIGLWLPATDTDPEQHSGHGIYWGAASKVEGGSGPEPQRPRRGEPRAAVIKGQPVTSRSPLRLNDRQPFPDEAPAGHPPGDSRQHRAHTRLWRLPL